MANRIAAGALGAFGLLLAGSAAAQAYKWRDADGKLHFSDAPPPAAKAEKLLIKPAVPENPEAATRFRESQAAQRAQPPHKQAAPQPSPQDCLAARRDLDVLSRQQPVYRLGKDGQRHYVDDADRDAEMQRAQNRVRRNCR